MRSRARVACAFAALSLALAAAAYGQAPAQPPPTAAEVMGAAAQVAKDPDLGRKIHRNTLRFKDRERPPEQKPDNSGLDWLMNLARWLSETGRLLVWVAGAVALALVLVGLRHWMKVRAEAARPARATLPSHVQSLDIRPESLPADIGAAAAALWMKGDHRAALALLYRGALSRLVHDHGVAIAAASTEGECVQLAARTLDADRGAFFAQLVRAWQLAVYGSRMPESQAAIALCREFDARFASRARAAA